MCSQVDSETAGQGWSRKGGESGGWPRGRTVAELENSGRRPGAITDGQSRSGE